MTDEIKPTKKYEFTGETKIEFGVTFKRIRALVTIPGVVVFRTASELLSRTCDAEEKARAAVDAFRRHGTEHPLIKAMGGIDWRRVERAGRAANREAPSAPVVTGAANLAEAV